LLGCPCCRFYGRDTNRPSGSNGNQQTAACKLPAKQQSPFLFSCVASYPWFLLPSYLDLDFNAYLQIDLNLNLDLFLDFYLDLIRALFFTSFLNLNLCMFLASFNAKQLELNLDFYPDMDVP
jgi:hypothetical protein